MQRLWEEEGIPARSHVLHKSTYEKLGRAEGIIQGYVDQCMSKLSQSEQEVIARVLDVLVSSPQPARISGLVAHANATRKDWPPLLLKDEVRDLFEKHLAPGTSCGPWPTTNTRFISAP